MREHFRFPQRTNGSVRNGPDYNLHGKNFMKNYGIPLIRFSVASPGGVVPFSEQLFDAPVPLERPTSSQTVSGKITYRVYLQAIEEFIRQHWDQFVQSISQQAGGPLKNIELIEVVAEKHGSDYHPARIRVNADGRTFCLVANVAITERGKDRIDKDYQWLKHFRMRYRNHLVPDTYFLARQTVFDTDVQEKNLVMFLAEWLEGYHEFHLSRDVECDTLGTVVWDMDQGYRLLSEAQSAEIYRQAAFILTYYYDVPTFREIFPWHHASGDFVVHLGGEALDVRMITVRQYEPRTVFREYAPANAVTALTIFLANLTIRMRLDRFDGVGEVAWAADHCVQATVHGFADAMKEKVLQDHCSQQVSDDLFGALEAMSPVEWAELFQFVVESYDRSAPDVPVVSENLPDHVFSVYTAVQSRTQGQ
jgi:hypothetical protein